MLNSGPKEISYIKTETFTTIIPIVTYGNVPDGFLISYGYHIVFLKSGYG